jgi:hypothetical protein
VAKSSGPNKSEKIREYYRNHRRVKPSQVVAALAAEGITVSAAQVSSVRHTMKKGRGRKRAMVAAAAPRRRKKSAGGGRASAGIERLIEVKKLADAVGGIDEARRYLDMLEQLQ